MNRLRSVLFTLILCGWAANCLAGGDGFWPKARAGTVAILVWGNNITSTSSSKMAITVQNYSSRKGSQITNNKKQIVLKFGAHPKAFQVFGGSPKSTAFKMEDIEAIRLTSDPGYSGSVKSSFQGISVTGKLSDGVFTAEELYMWN